jgi:Lon protease-like protein
MHNVPLFPLPRVVLLPHTLLPLHIFEPRYRTLIATAIEEDLTFGIPTIQDGGLPSADSPPFHAVMGLAQVVRKQILPDGRSNIVVLGVGRARFVEEVVDPSVPYRSAHCARLDDIRTPSPAGSTSEQQIGELRLAARQVVHGRDDLTSEIERLFNGERDPSEVVDVLAHMCLRGAEDRLAYINLPTFDQRATHLLATLTTILYACRPPAAEG